MEWHTASGTGALTAATDKNYVCGLLGLQFESLQSLIRRSGLEFPDTAFLFNIADQTVCGRGTSCAAPIFSTYSHQEDLDALFPVGAVGNPPLHCSMLALS